MPLTPLGKALRKLRIDRGIKLLNMAKDLETSAAFLSSVENGRKSVPSDWVDKLIRVYDLDFIAGDELRQAAEISDKSLRIDLKGTKDVSRELALVFARNFDKLGVSEAKELIKKLSEGRERAGGDE